MAASALRSIVRFNRLNWRPWSATRCAIGLAIPLTVGIWTGNQSFGVLACLGALYAGFNSFRGTYALRLKMMATTTLTFGTTTLIGSAVSHNPVAAVCAIAVVAFTLASFSSLGTPALLVSIQGTAVLIVLAGVPAAGANPVGNTVSVFAGGLVQMLLLTIIWPFNPRYPERRAVGRVYVGLAEFVRSVSVGENDTIPDAEPLQEARSMVGRLREQPMGILYPLRVAETIRACLVGFAKEDVRLRSMGPSAIARADASCEVVEAALRQTDLSLRHGRPLTASIAIERSERPEWEEHQRWIDLVGACFERLQHPPDKAPPIPRGETRLRLSNLFSVEALRALSLQHAGRYALFVAGAFALSRYWHTTYAYWLPLSTCILLRPDYATTVNRGVARTVGTIVGVALASAIAAAHPGPAEIAVLIVASAWIGSSVYLANYAIFTAVITCFAVFSVAATEVSQHTAIVDRLEATLAGAAVAVVANLVWPIWQARRVASLLADATTAQIAYAKEVVALFGGTATDRADRTRHRARALRGEAENIVQAAAIEPGWSRRHLPDAVEDVLERLEFNAAKLLSLHAEAISRGLTASPAGSDAARNTLKDAEELLARLRQRDVG